MNMGFPPHLFHWKEQFLVICLIFNITTCPHSGSFSVFLFNEHRSVIKNILYTKYPRKKKKKEEKRSPLERVNQNLNDPRRTRCVFISAWIRICTEIFPTHYVARKDGSAQMAREKKG